MSTPLTDNILTIGPRIREARAGESQAKFAKAVGMAPPTLSMLENSQRPPKLETLLRISEVTKRPVDWFLGREDIDPTPQDLNEALQAVKAARAQLEVAEGHLERLLHVKHAEEKATREPQAEDILSEPIPIAGRKKRK